MKNNSLYFLISFCIVLTLNTNLFSNELKINSTKIHYDKVNKVTILEVNVSSSDEKGNKIFSEYAKYNKLEKTIETKGDTKIITSGGYEILSNNVVLNNKKNKK